MKWCATKVVNSGNGIHIAIPKPLRQFLNWPGGTELMMGVDDAGGSRIITLEGYVNERIAADRERRMAELEGALR